MNVCDTPELGHCLREPEMTRKLATLPQRRTSIIWSDSSGNHQSGRRLLRVMAAPTKLNISPKRFADLHDLHKEYLGAMLGKLP